MRELVMLAKECKEYNSAYHHWWVSEKLDGMRVLYLPETRGRRVETVQLANRARDSREYICSGLWTRLGKPVVCPDWFVADLPDRPLDGELFLRRGGFQETMSICKQLNPDDASWRKLRYCIFDSPSYSQIYLADRINNPNYTKLIETPSWIHSSPYYLSRPFEQVYSELTGLSLGAYAFVLPQQVSAGVDVLMDEVLSDGGEGLMLRDPGSRWVCKRSDSLLKLKPILLGDGEVVGWEPGEGKYTGMLGSVVVEWMGVTVCLSGMVDSLRDNSCFPLGSRVEFAYNGLTNLGIPRFPRFRRIL